MATGKVLSVLSENLTETILLCAVHGGVFAEGVDFAAHMALGAFVVGPGLPALTLEQELIREYHDGPEADRPDAGFEYAYIFPGMNRVVQAAGRVIRTENDRGFVMLLGRRFAEDRYAEKLPGYFRDEMVVSKDPTQVVRSFWQTLPC